MPLTFRAHRAEHSCHTPAKHSCHTPASRQLYLPGHPTRRAQTGQRNCIPESPCSRTMGSCKFYLAVGFIALMAAPLAFTEDLPKITTKKPNETTDNKINTPTSKLDKLNKITHTTSKQETNNLATSDKPNISTNTPNFSFLNDNVALMGGGVILLCLLISNLVLTCCICSLRRRVSKWAITRNGNLSDVTEDRYVVGDAGLPADQAVELSAIYTMPDKTVGEGNAEEAHKAEGATATAADPANGDAQSPEQAEALLPEPPADVAEPTDDVTDVLLVV